MIFVDLGQLCLHLLFVSVVDREVSPYRLDEEWQTLGARWQQHPAARIIEDAKGIPLEPSQAVPGKTSKIAIDATPQLQEEGGPAVTPAIQNASSRTTCRAHWNESTTCWTTWASRFGESVRETKFIPDRHKLGFFQNGIPPNVDPNRYQRIDVSRRT